MSPSLYIQTCRLGHRQASIHFQLKVPCPIGGLPIGVSSLNVTGVHGGVRIWFRPIARAAGNVRFLVFFKFLAIGNPSEKRHSLLICNLFGLFFASAEANESSTRMLFTAGRQQMLATAKSAVFLVLLVAFATCVDSDNAMTDTDRIVPEHLFDEVQMEVTPLTPPPPPQSSAGYSPPPPPPPPATPTPTGLF